MIENEILEMIYQANGEVSVFDLLYEFGIPYKELKPILDGYTGSGVLATEDGKTYTFIGDGRMFSDECEPERTDAEPAEGTDGQSEDAEETDAETDGEEDEEGTDAETEEDEETGDESGEDFPSEDDLCECISDSIKDGFEVGKEGEKYVISVSELALGDGEADFELLPRGGKVYLCDRGTTLTRLGEKIEVDGEARAAAERIAEESGVALIGDKLCAEVSSAEQTLACLFRLYAAMERVLHVAGKPREEAEKKEREIPELYIKALEIVVRLQRASFSDLIGTFGFDPRGIGPAMEWMEYEGFITSFDPEIGGRRVFLTQEEFNRRFGNK